MDEIQWRHEWKHEINQMDILILRSRLSAVMKPDEHAIDGRYDIRSLYFDNISDKALREKIDGVNRREKFRIRFYNNDTSLIHLEKKTRVNSLGTKKSCTITKEETQRLLDGDYSWMPGSAEELCRELYSKIMAQGLRPKTIVEYKREPFIFAPGNVRVTIDSNIRTGLSSTDFLNPRTITIRAGDAPAILEVKWDNFLPDIIRDAVTLPGRRAAAFSKYAQCRIYG